jgi:restriction endonuclease
MEFRGGGWLEDEHRTRRRLDLLKELGPIYVIVDEPQGFKSPAPSTVGGFVGGDPFPWA